MNVIHLQETVRLSAGQGDGNVDEAHDTRLLHEVAKVETVLGVDVGRDQRFGPLDCMRFRKAFIKTEPYLPDHMVRPADASANKRGAAFVLDLENLAEIRSERMASEAASLGQDLFEILTAEREISKIREHTFSREHVLLVRHSAWNSVPGGFALINLVSAWQLRGNCSGGALRRRSDQRNGAAPRL